MLNWSMFGVIVVVVAGLLFFVWNIFFSWYRQKRERKANEFLNKLRHFKANKSYL